MPAKILRMAGTFVLLLGIAGLVFPFAASFVNRQLQEDAVREYAEAAETVPGDAKAQMLAEAEAYNREIYSKGSTLTMPTEWEESQYENLLSVSETGVFGYLEIPDIDLKLPVYHGTEDRVLQAGAGHMAGSSFPIGGGATHAVLTSHSGIPTARLFTDLSKLRNRDVFTVTVLDRLTTYQVDDIKAVDPVGVELEILPDRDYCTLVTCTPIGLNTQRLLVRGIRTGNIEPAGEASDQAETPLLPAAVLACIVIIVLTVIAILLKKRKAGGNKF